MSPEDAALVLRRAAELDTPSLEQHDALDEQVVRDAARDVGLSDAAVDQAVLEWRSGILSPLPALRPDRLAGLLATVVAEAHVDLPPHPAGRQVELWLESQWMERCRTRGDETEWRPRRGVLAGARRAMDLNRQLRLTGVDRLRVCIAPAAQGSRVRLVADVGDTRLGLLVGLVAVPAAVAGAITLLVTTGGGDPMYEVLLTAPITAGTGAVGWLGAKGALAIRRANVADALERGLGEIVTARSRPPLHERAASWALQRVPRPPR